MLMPYCTIGNDVEVTHTPLDATGHTLVHIEVPDEVYCFKVMECLIPSYKVSGVVGMTDAEINYYVDFCKHNAHLLLKYAKEGGIANA